MKKRLFISMVAFVVNGCDTQSTDKNILQESRAISVILDVTDPRVYSPKPDDVLRLYRCNEAPNAEYLFRLRSITDKRLVPVATTFLPDGVSMEKENKQDDPHFRNKSILSFYTEVRNTLGQFYSMTDTIKSLDNSECFRVIASELSFLTGSSKRQCILLIASDLMEKSDLWDFYAAMPGTSKVLADKLDDTGLLPPVIKNVEVIFLFNPKDRLEDQHFSLLVEGYRLALESRGVIVKVQASL